MFDMKIPSRQLSFRALKARIEQTLEKKPTFKTAAGTVLEFSRKGMLTIRKAAPGFKLEKPHQIKISHPFLRGEYTIRFPHALEKLFGSEE